jgi:hypothetical protein
MRRRFAAGACPEDAERFLRAGPVALPAGDALAPKCRMAAGDWYSSSEEYIIFLSLWMLLVLSLFFWL